MQPKKSELLGNKPLSQPKVSDKVSLLTRKLMEIPGVEGTGLGHEGRLVIYVSRSGLESAIEKELHGQDFEVRVTGVISAQ